MSEATGRAMANKLIEGIAPIEANRQAERIEELKTALAYERALVRAWRAAWKAESDLRGYLERRHLGVSHDCD